MNRTDTVKAVLWGAVGLGAVFVIWRTYGAAKWIGNGLGEAAGAIEEQIVAGIGRLSNSLGAASDKAKNAAKDTGDSVAGFLTWAAGNNQGAGSYTKQIKDPSSWDVSTLAYIADWNRKHGRQENDFSGWQVFDSGLMITPNRVYVGMDYTSPEMEKADGFSIIQYWKPPQYAEGKIRPIETASYSDVSSLTSTAQRNIALIDQELARLPAGDERAYILNQERQYQMNGGNYLG